MEVAQTSWGVRSRSRDPILAFACPAVAGHQESHMGGWMGWWAVIQADGCLGGWTLLPPGGFVPPTVRPVRWRLPALHCPAHPASSVFRGAERWLVTVGLVTS